MDRLGWPFAPKVAFMYNGSPTAINYAETVCLYTSAGKGVTRTIEWTEPEPGGGSRDQVYSTQARVYGTTFNIPTIARQTAVPTGTQAPFGVALQDIGITAWGKVCIEGVCDVRIPTANVVSLGACLCATAAGAFIAVLSANVATASHVRAMALESADTTTVTIAVIKALFLGGTGHQILGFSTAGY